MVGGRCMTRKREPPRTAERGSASSTPPANGEGGNLPSESPPVWSRGGRPAVWMDAVDPVAYSTRFRKASTRVVSSSAAPLS